ncbi:MAG: hypothetical protein N2506_05730 [Dehalococcoidales bacterium]|nr:hypothetical protein [Dehalococcoidales bacterium]
MGKVVLKKSAPSRAASLLEVNTGPETPARLENEYATLKEAAAAVQRMRLTAQKEMEQIRRMKADALRYQQEMAAWARSEAHQVVLKARLDSQREVEETIRKASQEIQKILADIRIIRITAQEELAVIRKLTDAARLKSMSIALRKELEKMNSEPKKNGELAPLKK